jgi:tetratricopeptide (TPR) repeat protein
MRFIIIILLFTCCALSLRAQDSASFKRKEQAYSKKSGYYNSNSIANDLKEAIQSDDETKAAQQYEKLSKQFEQNGDLPKAEAYLKKALDIYTRQKNTPQIANTTRTIAKLQESQNKIDPAILNYKNAAEVSTDKTLEAANTNDASRLKFKNNLSAQEDLAQKNVALFKADDKKGEEADAYKQLAETQLKQNNHEAAASSFKKAIAASPRASDATDQLSKSLVAVYSNNNQFDTAITITQALIFKAKETQNEPEETDLMMTLATLYSKDHKSDSAIAILQQAYILAVKNNQTIKAKQVTAMLSTLYQSAGNTDLSLITYKRFLSDLDTIIKKDSALIDSKLFALTEGRIQELEQEKKLQGELIRKTTTFNYVLIGSVLLMLLFILLIARSLKTIKERNKKIALQSLRREMNPHFIFNSLNSVNQYIAENNELEANKYLSSYSSLMRNVMENSNKDFVSISTELDQIKKYLELEHRRFKDKFEYSISVDEDIDKELWLMPNMLLQPHLENAIWHGLRYKETKGLLSIQFQKTNNNISISIQDNGIGLEKSRALKTTNQKAHQSRGLTNTKERIQLLNDIYKMQINMQMDEIATDKGGGTSVIIQIPLLHKLP